MVPLPIQKRNHQTNAGRSDRDPGRRQKVVLCKRTPNTGASFHLRNNFSWKNTEVTFSFLTEDGSPTAAPGISFITKHFPMTAKYPLYEIVSRYKDRGIDIIAYAQDTLISGICPNQYTKLESRINHTDRHFRRFSIGRYRTAE